MLRLPQSLSRYALLGLADHGRRPVRGVFLETRHDIAIGPRNSQDNKKPGPSTGFKFRHWLRGTDSNRRPSGYESGFGPLS